MTTQELVLGVQSWAGCRFLDKPYLTGFRLDSSNVTVIVEFADYPSMAILVV